MGRWLINWYEPHPEYSGWTHISGQSPEELDLSFPSAIAEREGGLKNTVLCLLFK